MCDSLRVLPECHADTLLVSIIGFKRANHKPSIGAVANAMKDKMKTMKVVGVIDDDKKSIPKYFEQFEIIEKKDNLLKKKHPSREHYLIVLHPAFEDWVFAAADKVGIDPADSKYGFKTKKYFRNISKNKNVDENQKVKGFLNDIKQQKNSPMTTIKKWITEILD